METPVIRVLTGLEYHSFFSPCAHVKYNTGNISRTIWVNTQDLSSSTSITLLIATPSKIVRTHTLVPPDDQLYQWGALQWNSKHLSNLDFIGIWKKKKKQRTNRSQSCIMLFLHTASKTHSYSKSCVIKPINLPRPVSLAMKLLTFLSKEQSGVLLAPNCIIYTDNYKIGPTSCSITMILLGHKTKSITLILREYDYPAGNRMS